MTTSTGHGHWHLHFWPKGRFGRWSVFSALAFLVGVLGLALAIASGEERGETLTDNWWLSGPALLGAAGAFSALVTGVVAMIHEHDRSIAVILSTLIGLLVASFVTGEIAVPH
ncbi:MAG TPA: hypothetical protein VI980_09255 [Acidimicrobiia bacterium]|nr:hypothetical protein [Acidimicrobiia bacterium]